MEIEERNDKWVAIIRGSRFSRANTEICKRLLRSQYVSCAGTFDDDDPTDISDDSQIVIFDDKESLIAWQFENANDIDSIVDMDEIISRIKNKIALNFIYGNVNTTTTSLTNKKRVLRRKIK